ncbi:uncharacterized protein LOC116119103 [Pistacia vera]|uniref:uncharacterized protein LOC116119095 n=1 Tax=Pistacia vera TaxID=55513 RepID=UPI0012639317|nr:uncharacterized protein LOC116119095 [Pistacia vera]XP_031260918.1 uncharacterized protein LOC116119103 [Pistacia vera]
MDSSSYSLNFIHPSCSSLFSSTCKKDRVLSTRVFASKGNSAPDHHRRHHHHCHNYCRIVDENMIVLRKRIHEMKMVERNYEAPDDWMQWEKRYYTSYDSIICDALGVLQGKLMNTRPSLALGIVVLMILSVPISSAMAFFQILEITKGILAGISMV